MPALKRFIDREEGDEESEEEDIEIAERVAQWKDPLTLTWLEKPVKTCVGIEYGTTQVADHLIFVGFPQFGVQSLLFTRINRKLHPTKPVEDVC